MEADPARLRLALPNKGRLAEPAQSLLKEAGFDFEADDRRLFAPCAGQELDLLFLRAEDIPEYLQDGVVDLGVTGANLVQESGARVDLRLELGFGRCSLMVAVAQDSTVDRPQELAGCTVATSHPRLCRRFFDRLQVPIRLIQIKGAVEVTPLLGVADAIVDLVATGSTLAVNGLRTVATVADSQAVLVGNPNLPETKTAARDRLEMAVGSVISAGKRKYLMMNAPSSALARITDLIPGLAAPTVMELATPGQIAIHAVVEAHLVWDLLKPLKAAGASSILVMQIENLIP